MDRRAPLAFRGWELASLCFCIVAVIAVTAGSARADTGGVGPVPKGHGRAFTVQTDEYINAGGTGTPGSGDPNKYEYRVQRVTPCAFHADGCVAGEQDTCPRLNAAETDDWVLSLEWRRVVGTANWGEPINLAEQGTCLNYGVIDPKPPWPEIRDRVVKYLPNGDWTHQPPSQKVLAVKPMIVYVSTPRRVPIPRITIGDHVVEAWAEVNDYEWNFGDHSGPNQNQNWDFTDPGRPYQDGQPCRTDDNCAGYVSHSYHQLLTNIRIGLTLHWTVHYRVDDDDWDVLPPEADMRTDGNPQPPITVVEAHAVLVH